MVLRWKACQVSEWQQDMKESLSPSPAEQELQRVVVVYETLPGWKSSTAGLTSFSLLPPNAQAYVHRIAQLIQVPS